MRKEDLPKSFCIAPWVHLYSDPDGSLRPCCTSEADEVAFGNTRQYTKIIDAVNSPGLRDLRKAFLAGERPDTCKRCWLHEDTSGNEFNSYRSYLNGMFRDSSLDLLDQTQADGTIEDFQLKYVDFRWGSTCNMACISCGPLYSSKWATELKQPIFQIPNKQYLLDELVNERLNEIETIYFVGGEPFLLPEHWRLLEALANSGRADKISLRYNTNMSTLQFEKKNALDYLPKFKDVELVASLDHYGEKAELIRYGTVWQEILDNLTYIKELKQPNIRVVTNTVVTTLNILDMPEILRMFRTMHLEGLLTPQTLYRAMDPWYLDCRNIPVEQRQQIIQEIEQVQLEYVEPELQNYRTLFIEDVKNFLLTDSPHDIARVNDHLIRQMALLDQRRGTNWRKTLNDLWNLVK
jgi:radical SAM protein with 4Fe4S-binding SPASM domain